MIRVLVTGSSGQLGRSLQKLADSYTDLSFHFTSKADLDIRDREALDQLFQDGQFDYCINCAAYTDVEQSERSPDLAFEVNEMGTANLADICKEHNVVLVHISTDYVFDGTKETGYSPADQPNPINAYGRSKWEGEKRIRETLDAYFIIRTSWLYSEAGNNFYSKIKKKATQGTTIKVTDKERGRPTHADNLANYILRLISDQNRSFGTYHYTDGVTMTWYEFAKKILAENNLLELVELVPSESYPSFAKRPACSVLIP